MASLAADQVLHQRCTKVDTVGDRDADHKLAEVDHKVKACTAVDTSTADMDIPQHLDSRSGCVSILASGLYDGVAHTGEDGRDEVDESFGATRGARIHLVHVYELGYAALQKQALGRLARGRTGRRCTPPVLISSALDFTIFVSRNLPELFLPTRLWFSSEVKIAFIRSHRSTRLGCGVLVVDLFSHSRRHTALLLVTIDEMDAQQREQLWVIRANSGSF